MSKIIKVYYTGRRYCYGVWTGKKEHGLYVITPFPLAEGDAMEMTKLYKFLEVDQVLMNGDFEISVYRADIEHKAPHEKIEFLTIPARLKNPEKEDVPKDFVRSVCKMIGGNYYEIAGRTRREEVVMYRKALAAYLYYLGYNTCAIGRAIDRDHSTVIHHVQAYWADSSTNDNMKEMWGKMLGCGN